ncbi:MAG: response regulator [Syntrophaceae bacterium]|nr:response regulator [Syntrophaceae bacterium]
MVPLLKTMIIDDEWLIRSELKNMLQGYPQIEIVGEAVNLTDAVRLYNKLKPELIFLDIHLPGGSGFDFLDRVQGGFHLIFLTAFDQYLENAMRYKPVDYLLKPINREKLARALDKIRNR